MTCPICNARVKEITINAHIDNNCKDILVVDGKGKQKLSPTSAVNQWSKIMSGAGSAKKKIKSLQIDTETYGPFYLFTALTIYDLVASRMNLSQQHLMQF